MPSYTLQEINRIVAGTLSGDGGTAVSQPVYDSRRLQHPPESLFFALQTPYADGHGFIQDAYRKGVRSFVVSRAVDLEEANIILVNDTLEALQTLAAWHRRRFRFPVIGITGSNGKTVVKEWLNTLLQTDYQIVRSPKSFNSQIGVPLSVWGIEAQTTLGIFEAGISQPGEMQKLERIIQPTIGILTNVGEAHSEGFGSTEEKLAEKLTLFTHADVVIGEARNLSSLKGKKTFTWSRTGEATLAVLQQQKKGAVTVIEAEYKKHRQVLSVPFTDDASVENVLTCWCVMLYLGLAPEEIRQRTTGLHPIDMRLQLNHAINGCLLINDSYSADTTSLRIALDFLAQQSAGLKRTVVLSDFYESGKADAVLYGEIAQLLRQYKIEKLVGIGEKIGALLPSVAEAMELQPYATTEEFIQVFKSSGFNHEVILLKGARKAGFERIAQLFEEKQHGTVLQINLSALTHNLKEYQKRLKPSTKIMAMVKAFAYGSGGAEIASVLQFNNVGYLGVAYADEGVELVQAGISLPVMVMNAEPSSFAALVDHALQPVIYSTALLQSFGAFVKSQGLTDYPVHLEIETGMNRLGFVADEVEDAATYFSTNSALKIQSVFSHLAGSEDAGEDDFTQLQAERFREAVAVLLRQISYPFLKHISNSAAVVRHPGLQMDMVRLGIGLYGIEPDAEDLLDLQPVAKLRSTVAQVKEVKSGESVSYNRRGVVHRDSRIATVRIGYADGYSRRFGGGVGKMLVNGKSAPVIGTVCMDMTMLDVTGIDGVKEGDDVMVFGAALPVQEVAKMIGTIPYEIMTGVSQRVKRVYYYE